MEYKRNELTFRTSHTSYFESKKTRLTLIIFSSPVPLVHFGGPWMFRLTPHWIPFVIHSFINVVNVVKDLRFSKALTPVKYRTGI